MKRIALFILTNLAILLVLSIVAQLTGLDAWLAREGSSLGALLVFAAFFGFSGAFVSLGLSKWLAKRATGLRVIDAPATAGEQWLIETVRALAQRSESACRKWGSSSLRNRTPSPPGPGAIMRWWRSAQACWHR